MIVVLWSLLAGIISLFPFRLSTQLQNSDHQLHVHVYNLIQQTAALRAALYISLLHADHTLRGKLEFCVHTVFHQSTLCSVACNNL